MTEDEIKEGFRHAMRRLATTIALVTAGEGEGWTGMAATAVMSVCAEPPTLLVAVNRTGASGAIGAMAVKNAAPDGYTLLVARIATHAILPALDSKLQQTDATAQQALGEARSASGLAQQNGQRLDQLGARVDGVEQRMAEAQRKRPRN